MIIVLVYVDEILVIGNDPSQIIKTMSIFHKTFKIKNTEELKYFWESEFAKSKEGIMMYQRNYALELISETGLSASNPTNIPIDSTIKITTREFGE